LTKANTDPVDVALEYLELLSSTTVGDWIWRKTKQIYGLQKPYFSIAAATTDINEGAYMLIGYDVP
jgi:hypothetical protein